LVGAALSLTLGLAGCGDFCVTGVINNGNGAVNVNGGNPPPPCAFPHVNTMMRAVALKTRVCESCSNAVKARHVFVTVQGIELHPARAEETVAATWIEIAPQFAGKPRQIDLIGDSLPELLEENVLVPSGNYSEVRLKLFRGSSENACGRGRWNCLVMADGEVEELGLPNEDSGLDLPIGTENGPGSSLLLPDSKAELQLHLEPRQVFRFSASEGLRPQIVLTGHAVIERQSSAAQSIIPVM
jgi:hypothetical protein